MTGAGLDTIAAISTAAGEGAIALIRLSGERAIEVADEIFRGNEKPSASVSHLQRLGEIVRDGRVIDQVMLSVHRAPASYTGEDLVEISCHGGVLVSARVLEVCLQAGARAARAGEFTERAFLAGKMDLTQAEAVIDLIRAQTDLALRSATEQLEGRLGAEVRTIRAGLIDMLAHIDASIDFPEEDVAHDSDVKLLARLDSVETKIASLLATAEGGRIMREGIRAVIYGATNAGKSSLLNRLLGYDRAIVSELPGTTRDTIEEVISFRGIPLRLADTAGIRSSTDPLERAGIERTEKTLAAADLVLHVVDWNAAKPAEFAEGVSDRPEILLLNKSDLPAHRDWEDSDALRISCMAPDGLRGLEERVVALISRHHLAPENTVAINARHRDCLRRAGDACLTARATLTEQPSAELVAVDLHIALRAVSEIIGGDIPEEILDSVFRQFCIGK